ncbi:MAG: SCO family protein, partial [Aestuariivirgaceae bacterium]
MSASRPLFIAACLILALLIGGVALTRAPDNTAVLTTGKALVGGPFRLTDQHGKTVSDTDFRGKYMLVVFGYTFCPDVCPAELQVVTAALDALGPKAERIQPVFITIDPERDTV